MWLWFGCLLCRNDNVFAKHVRFGLIKVALTTIGEPVIWSVLRWYPVDLVCKQTVNDPKWGCLYPDDTSSGTHFTKRHKHRVISPWKHDVGGVCQYTDIPIHTYYLYIIQYLYIPCANNYTLKRFVKKNQLYVYKKHIETFLVRLHNIFPKHLQAFRFTAGSFIHTKLFRRF